MSHNTLGPALTLVILALAATLCSQAPQTPAAETKAVPVIDGGAGPCSADFTVTDNAGNPIYAAKIKVHIAYGFFNVRKLDLEVGTNSAGKARFVGLPNRVKSDGLYFQISEGDRVGEVFDDPSNTCKNQFTVPLQKKTS